MNNTILAVLGYLGWTVFLLAWLESYRTLLVMKKEKAPNGFQTDGSDMSPFGLRLTRTFGNCMESFTFIGGTMLLAIAAGAAAITNPLALYLLLARVGQSVTHLISTSEIAVQIRFVFFLIQQGIVIFWLYLMAVNYLG